MKPIRILLAEDNQADVVLVQHALRHYGIEHELHVARDGEAALDYLVRMGAAEDAPRPDVILLDLNLPKLEGQEVIREFRGKKPEAAIPIIALTSSDAPADRRAMSSLGVCHYFRKPIELDAFLKLGEVVAAVVGLGAANRAT